MTRAIVRHGVRAHTTGVSWAGFGAGSDPVQFLIDIGSEGKFVDECGCAKQVEVPQLWLVGPEDPWQKKIDQNHRGPKKIFEGFRKNYGYAGFLISLLLLRYQVSSARYPGA